MPFRQVNSRSAWLFNFIRIYLGRRRQTLRRKLTLLQAAVGVFALLFMGLSVIYAAPGTDQIVVMELARGGAYAVTRAGLRLLGAGALFLALVIWVGSRLLDRYILWPVERLQAGAERIGLGDLSHRITTVRQDEAGRVAEAFNHRAASLSERDAGLAAEIAERKRAEAALLVAQAELEERVRERTAEFENSNRKLGTANELLEQAIQELQEEVVERRRAENELTARNEQLAALNQIGQMLNKLAKPAEILELTYLTLGQIMDNGNIYIALYDEANQEVSFPIYSIHGELQERLSRRFGNGLTEYVIRTKAPLLVTHDACRMLDERGIELIGRQAESLLSVPMMVGDKVIGVITVQDYFRENAYGETHLGLCATFAAQAAVALENARLYATLHEELAERKRAEDALRKSETELRALFTAMSDTVILYDQDGRYLKIAPTGTKLLYRPHENMLGRTIHEILPEREAQLIQSSIRQALEMHRTVTLDYSLEIGGQSVWFTAAISPMEKHAVVLVARDITERKRAEEALRESEERYLLAIQGANDGLWDWDLRSNCIYYSPRWKAMLGCEQAEVGNSPEEWFKRVHPEDVDQVRVDLGAHLKGLTAHFEDEHRMRHQDGSLRWMLARGLAVRDADGVAYRMAGSLTDITQRKQAEEQLVYDAFHDPLTGLPNRALFADRLERAIERAKRHTEYVFAVLFLDLDRFKVINDSLGHNIGDDLLVGISRRLKVLLRSSDTAARLGGDEFVILAEDLRDAEDALVIANRVLEELKLPFEVSGHKIFTSSSIGIVLSAPGYDQPADILRDADIALYRAKALGKNRCELFDMALRTQAINRLELESELRSALERQEFEIYYQPIQCLQTGRITGFEALLRWNSPSRGLVSPAEFVPVAEETGLIIPIGEWVLREACQQMRTWQDQFPMDPPLAININISGKQFAHPALVEQIEQVLSDTGLKIYSLRLEITESVFMDHAGFANTVLTRLRDLGVHLQIDDFGTGYSSLGYLQRFPINTIKIDRSFVSRMGSNGDNTEIVKTIVTLARDLGMDAVAEGIETAEQLDQLKSLDCPYGQGFLFARPLDSAAAAGFLSQASSKPVAEAA